MDVTSAVLGGGIASAFAIVSSIATKRYETANAKIEAHNERLLAAALKFSNAAARVGEGVVGAHGEVRSSLLEVLLCSSSQEVQRCAREVVRVSFGVDEFLRTGTRSRPRANGKETAPAPEIREALRPFLEAVRREIGDESTLAPDLD